MTNFQILQEIMTSRAWVTKIVFSGENEINLNSDDIIVIVGANNVGKSGALRGIKSKLIKVESDDKIIKSISLELSGSPEEVERLVREIGRKPNFGHYNNELSAFGHVFYLDDIAKNWSNGKKGLEGLTRLFCNILSAEERLNITKPAPNVSITNDPLEFPAQWMMRDDEIELSVSQEFRKAFNADLIIHRNAGGTIPLYVGERPLRDGIEDRASLSYVRKIEALSPIHEQGDGMRSFAGIFMALHTGLETILMIDEPEAFLHPPQARHMGHMLASDKSRFRQIFIATHSGDVLRGILDAGSKKVRILRLQREGMINYAKEIQPAEIIKIWGDPLLRHSNVLDGIFYEKVVLCESDSDAKFYSAVADAIYEASSTEHKKPDVMFTHCGGKDRMAVVVKALKAVGVPVIVVADFDVLNSERPLRDIVEAAQGDWHVIEANWRKIKLAVDEKKPEVDLNQLKDRVKEAMESVLKPEDLKQAQKQIASVWKVSSPWGTAKTAGASYLPSGQTTVAYNQLILDLKAIGVFVVEIGELECFVRSIGSHGPKWVNEVLSRDLMSDDELLAARRFVSEFLELGKVFSTSANKHVAVTDSFVKAPDSMGAGIESPSAKTQNVFTNFLDNLKKLVNHN